MAPAGPGIRGMSAYHALPSRAALRLGLAGGRGLGPGRRVPALPIFGGAMAEERRGQAQRDRDQLTPDEVDEIVQPGFEDPLDRQPVQARPQSVEAVDNVIAAAQRIARFKLGRARDRRRKRGRPGWTAGDISCRADRWSGRRARCSDQAGRSTRPGRGRTCPR